MVVVLYAILIFSMVGALYYGCQILRTQYRNRQPTYEDLVAKQDDLIIRLTEIQRRIDSDQRIIDRYRALNEYTIRRLQHEGILNHEHRTTPHAPRDHRNPHSRRTDRPCLRSEPPGT